jgi:hypothetical protein
MPSSPNVEPSTDASVIVLRDGVPCSTRAISVSAAVSAALLGASGTEVASRAATITIWCREAPARRPITFRSGLPSSERKESSTAVKPLAANECAT